MAYCFTIENGMPGYLPNSIEHHRAETITEALTIVRDSVDRFCADDYAHDKPWRTWVQRARVAPDASMWNACLAEAYEGAECLMIAGLTEAEYAQLEAMNED